MASVVVADARLRTRSLAGPAEGKRGHEQVREAQRNGDGGLVSDQLLSKAFDAVATAAFKLRPVAKTRAVIAGPRAVRQELGCDIVAGPPALF